MFERLTSCLGTIVLLLLVLAGVIWLGYTYEEFGLFQVPPQVITAVEQWRPTAAAVSIETLPIDVSSWSNPLEDLPPLLEAEAVIETPPPTPVPPAPVDAAVYRTEVLLRLRALAETLEQWLDLNKQLGANMALLDDPNWQAQMNGVLDRLSSNAQAIAGVTPAPAEYTSIQALLERIQTETETLVDTYTRAMQTRGAEDFRASGEAFERVKTYLGETVIAMLDAGWEIQ